MYSIDITRSLNLDNERSILVDYVQDSNDDGPLLEFILLNYYIVLQTTSVHYVILCHFQPLV